MPFPRAVLRRLILAGLGAVAPVLAGAATGAGQGGPAPALLGLIRTAGGGAVLIRIGAERARPLRLRETRAGWTLLAIGAGSARLEAPDGVVVEIALAAAAPGNAVSAGAPPLPGAPAAGPPASERGERDGPGPPASGPDPSGPASGGPAETAIARRFSRDDIRLRLATELPRILSGAAVQPRIRGTEVVGLELVGFPMDTVLGEAGLVPGDVLLAVNGREVRGIESLGLLLQRFQTAREVELTLDRGGDIVALRFEIE